MDLFISLSFNIWEGNINQMVPLPNGNGPEKNNFLTSGKILHLTEKCEIKLNKIQNYVIVLFLLSLLIPPNSPVYSIAAS